MHAQSKFAELEKKRKEATSDQKEKNTKRAKLDADVSDLEEQIRKHKQTQVTIASYDSPNVSFAKSLKDNWVCAVHTLLKYMVGYMAFPHLACSTCVHWHWMQMSSINVISNIIIGVFPCLTI